MNEKYFKIQTNIPETIELLTACLGSYPNEKFGGVQYLYRVKHQGIEKAWYASERQHQDLQLYTVGTILVITKKEEGTKKFTQIVPEGDITVQVQNRNLQQPKTTKAVETLKKEQQEQRVETQDRILKGMAANEAATLLSVWAKDKDPDQIVEVHAALTDKIYKKMFSWHTGLTLPF